MASSWHYASELMTAYLPAATLWFRIGFEMVIILGVTVKK
jgi:hypothetical protein